MLALEAAKPEDVGGTGDWPARGAWYEVDVVDGPGPQQVQSRFDARGWSPAEQAVMATLLAAGAAHGQRWAAAPTLGGVASGAATGERPGEREEREIFVVVCVKCCFS
jgi:hypothetical protein